MLADDVLERHEALVADGDEAVEDRRHLDPGEVLGAGLGVADDDREVERQPGDVGERVGRVDGQRGEDGEDPVLEELLAELLLVAVELGPAQELDAVPAERRAAGPNRARAWRSISSRLLGPDRLEHARAASGPLAARTATPAAIRRLRPATRTMKNSSRLLAKIARKRARSSSGRSGSSASSRTRWLKRSQESSRSMNRSSYFSTRRDRLGVGHVGRLDVEGVGGVPERLGHRALVHRG